MAVTAIIFLFFGIFVSTYASPVAQQDARYTRDATSQACRTIGEDIAADTAVDSTVAILQPRQTCSAWKQNFTDSGYYFLSPTGGCEMKVFCDMCINDGSGWIIIQRRRNGDVSFEDKFMSDYKNGFGDYTGNYWIGLEKLHIITRSANYDLYMGIKTIVSTYKNATYTKFRVKSEAQKYEITFDENANTTLNQQKGNKFSTRDVDNDVYADHTCSPNSDTLYGGWWFGDNHQGSNAQHPSCYHTNLNGKYGSTGGNEIKWQQVHIQIDETIMAIRRSS